MTVGVTGGVGGDASGGGKGWVTMGNGGNCGNGCAMVGMANGQE